ncbi:MAG TPA: efflux RND transporter periplasmic adaptor subunit [Rariglobus sp.]|jgi:RND family efflux transporter MFP subunit|nr:efflux RND transporter periplasmic adaptor subunit [Rariglobus sp.]
MEPAGNHAPVQSGSDVPGPEAPSPKKGAWGVWLALILFVALVVFTVGRRAAASREVAETTAKLSMPTVATTLPRAAPSTVDLVLPGSVDPFQTTSVYARTDGYIKRWMVDIGARVKAGELLAEIEAPDQDQQLQQARADVQQSEANLALAKLTADRWKSLLKESAVAQQDADEKTGAYAVAVAALASAKANLSRLQHLKDFQKVVAPFEGTITARNVNVGDLVNSSGGTSGGSATELFHIQQDDPLRIHVSVPETAAGAVKIGAVATVELASLRGSPVKASIARTADAIDPVSRTLPVELDVPNANHAFFAGGYATVHFPLHIERTTFSLPVNTLLFRPGGTEVGIVGGDGIVQMRKITIGRDYGTTVEVMGGVSADDRIILNPSDSLATGDKVVVNNGEIVQPK